MKLKLIKSLSLLACALVLFLFPNMKVPGLDDRAEDYFNSAIQKAGLAYATARVLNASVSVIQNSEVQLEPAGVGISLAVGQVVDPINDMTERLSDVLVTAIGSLGVQRILYEIGVSIVPTLLGVFMIILSILVWFHHNRIDAIRKFLLGMAAIIIAARFFLPVASIGNHFLYEHYFLNDIAEARENLVFASNEFDKLAQIHLPEIDGFAGTVKNSASFLKAKSIEFKDAIVAITQNMGEIISNLLTLTWLYVGIFFVQVIALPIIMFWLLVKIANAVLSTGFPPIISRTTRTVQHVEAPR
ncbi:MAG: hypothetical protein JRH15_16190 [Deltaproteobacteria bacterium]|nr:hypothetical protein [Deltaproteobacteria bacterium]